jgi:hypothetical protein
MPTLLPRVARVRAAYVWGADGSNGCPANSAKITDMPTCEDAAASVGVTSVTTETNPSFPSGCYERTNGYGMDFVYLNAHANGRAVQGSKPLCKGAHPWPAACAASSSRGPGG